MDVTKTDMSRFIVVLTETSWKFLYVDMITNRKHENATPTPPPTPQSHLKLVLTHTNHMDPSDVRTNGDLMKYWETVQCRPWRKVTEEDKRKQGATDAWNHFHMEYGCPPLISMNFNKDGTRKTKQQNSACKKPGHCTCNTACCERTDLLLNEEEEIMKQQPSSQPFEESELVTLPSYVTDIKQGMLPPDDEIMAFIKEYEEAEMRNVIAKEEQYIDEMECLLDEMPTSQPGFNPDLMLSSITNAENEQCSILAYDTQYDYSDDPSQNNALTQDTESYGSQGYDGSVELTPSSVQQNNNSYSYIWVAIRLFCFS